MITKNPHKMQEKGDTQIVEFKRHHIDNKEVEHWVKRGLKHGVNAR
jgi:hypothetical protein